MRPRDRASSGCRHQRVDVGDVEALVNALCAFEEVVRIERGPGLKATTIGVSRAALTRSPPAASRCNVASRLSVGEAVAYQVATG
jgi:hypothetical protein